MKKRLFITSALMTAVMAASLATGTYAWYQVASGGVSLAAIKGNITTNTTATLDALEIPLTWSDLSGIQLTENDTGRSYVINQAGQTVDVTAKVVEADRCRAVTLTLGAIANPLPYVGTYTVTVQSADPVRISKDSTNVYNVGSVGASLTFTVVIESSGYKDGSNVISFYASVKGGTGIEDNVTGSLTATIAVAPQPAA